MRAWLFFLLLFLTRFAFSINDDSNDNRTLKTVEFASKSLLFKQQSRTSSNQKSCSFGFGNFWMGISQKEGEYLIHKIFAHAMNKLGLSIIFDNQSRYFSIICFWQSKQYLGYCNTLEYMC